MMNQDLPVQIIAGCIAGLFSIKIIQLTYQWYQYGVAKNTRERKRKDLDQIITNWSHQILHQMSEEESLSVVEMPFEKLRDSLRTGALSAVRVLHAYQYQAVKQNQKLNFICEPVMEAQIMAEDLDQMSQEERLSKPLFGIPISVKENYMIQGYESTCGCTSLLNNPSSRTSAILQALISQGAVPFIRTNIPQTCMAFDTMNPIYGTTVNPHNKERSCGGSSGGEGAAIGSGASILGFGSDIGGSVRIPAAWCGCYSLKPTALRLSFQGDVSTDLNERIVSITCGPLGRDVDSIVVAMRSLLSEPAFSVDPYIPPVPFNDQMLSSERKLRIAYFYSAPPIDISHGVRRSIDTTLTTLRRLGHEVVQWNPPDLENMLSSFLGKLFFADGGRLFCESLANDELSPCIRETVYLSYFPVWLKKLLADYLARPFFPSYLLNYLRSSCGTGNVSELWKLEHEIRNYRQSVVRELKRLNIDAIVCPAMPVPAMRVGECKDALGAICFMGYFNLLNFPSGIVPITKMTTNDIEVDKREFPVKDMWHKAMKYNLDGSEGLPIAVQCVSLPFQDEMCLRLMRELEQAVAYHVSDHFDLRSE